MDTVNSQDGALAISEDLVQSPVHKSPGISVTSFEDALSQPLKLHEDLKNGCGGQLWPAGTVLGKYLLRQHGNGLEHKSM